MPQRTIIFSIAMLAAAFATPCGFAQGRRGMGPGHHPAARPERLGKAPKSNQDGVAQTPIDEFARMSPQERQKVLGRLPPGRADKVRKQLDDYNHMTPGQQAAAREQLDAFRNLPPQRQEGMRKAFAKFSREPAERQQAMRQELNQLRGLPEAERRERLNSPEFNGRFTNNERKIVREMSDLLPNE